MSVPPDESAADLGWRSAVCPRDRLWDGGWEGLLEQQEYITFDYLCQVSTQKIPRTKYFLKS